MPMEKEVWGSPRHFSYHVQYDILSVFVKNKLLINTTYQYVSVNTVMIPEDVNPTIFMGNYKTGNIHEIVLKP